jgi:hypothetical protein
MYAREPGAYHELVVKQIARLTPHTLRDTLRSPDSDKSSHLITLTEPSAIGRSVPEKNIASRVVFELVWDKHIKSRVDEMQALYNLFQGNTTASPTVGWIFESRIHQVLRQRNAIHLSPICGHCGPEKLLYDKYTSSKERADTLVTLQLSRSEEHPLHEGIELDVGHYYRLPAKDFPTIDSLALIHPPGEPSPILLMFKITRDGSRYDVNPGSLLILEGLEFPPDTRKYYVLVTPPGIKPQITVPKEHFTDRGMDITKPDEIFPVFHCPVDTDMLFTSTPCLGFGAS